MACKIANWSRGAKDQCSSAVCVVLAGGAASRGGVLWAGRREYLLPGGLVAELDCVVIVLVGWEVGCSPRRCHAVAGRRDLRPSAQGILGRSMR